MDLDLAGALWFDHTDGHVVLSRVLKTSNLIPFRKEDEAEDTENKQLTESGGPPL